MKELAQLKNLFEALGELEKDDTVETVKEDDYDQYEGHGWSGSDWYAPLKSMDEYIDKHGLSPESIMQAANNEAEFYSGPMGYRGDWDAAAQSLKDAWIRMTERGQQLQRMFAPAESVHEDGDASLVDSLQKAIRSAEVDADFHGLYIDVKKILRTFAQ